jgi:sugar phosphate permease
MLRGTSIRQAYGKYDQLRSKVFMYTFISYSMIHLLRKSYSNMKMKLESEASFDPTFLSVIDTVFMLFYAIGSFFSGSLGEILSSSTIVSVSLIGSGFSVLLFAILVSLQIEHSENEILRTFIPIVRSAYLIFLSYISYFIPNDSYYG